MSNSIEKLAKEAERLAKNLQSNPFSAFDRIAEGIQEQKENAMAMEFTKCIGELLRKNGVVPKMTEYTRNFETDKTFETRYGVSIDELDFSEHDKVFEDKIADLEDEITSLKSHMLRLRERCTDDARRHFENGIYGCLTIVNRNGDLELENQQLKQRIAELEEKNKNLVDMINELQLEKAHIDCDLYDANKRITELESKETVDLPFDPLETANYLINATWERETSSLERGILKCPKYVSNEKYGIDELEQIAEHLLIYCKHNKECEE